ncbi:MAG: hypothetical protein WCB15_31135 [Desulfobacterales bacterium]
MAWFVVILAILFLAAGAALAYVVGAAAVLAFIATDNIRYLAVLPQRIFSQLDIFALMAMVLFIFIHLIARLIGSDTARPADRN